MASPSPIPLASLVVLSFTLALLTPLSTAHENNVLLTGDVLGSDDELSYRGNTFVMQGDCNLVLYNQGSGFESNTHGQGTNCTLTLSDEGQFVIMSGGGAVWTSTPTVSTKKGSYAAVLRPDGQVAIYGPAVWSTPEFHSSAADARYDAELDNIPLVRNVLFSSQVLYSNSKLATRDYTFTMKDDCNLVLFKATEGQAVWQSGTQGKGKHCFLRLDHRGQLAVADDRYKTVWRSKRVSGQGDYVLVLQINGRAVIYGPVVWSTVSS